MPDRKREFRKIIMSDAIKEIYKKADALEKSFEFPNTRIIDINNLHAEIQMNSEYVFQAYKRKGKLANVVSQIEELKKQTRSKLREACIKDPSLCDPEGKKYTKDKGEAYYRQQSEYIEIINALMAAEYELVCWEGMQKAFEDRKWLIKDAVALAMSEYFESVETNQTRVVMSQQQALDVVEDQSLQSVVEQALSAEKNEEKKQPEEKKPPGPAVEKPNGSIRKRGRRRT